MNEGVIIFADEGDYKIDANFIINGMGSRFIVGTSSEDNPYTHKLIFTLHGSYFDP